jgi:uncharacterized caspase-like protein
LIGDLMTIEPRRIHALIIGISNYGHLNPLRTCGNDAVDFYKLLTETLGYPQSQVTLLLDNKATKKSIDAGLESLARRVKQADTVILFFSGHGLQRLGGFAQGEYVCPIEANLDDLPATAISSQEMSQALQALNVPRVVMFLDACHSGGIGESQATSLGTKSGLSQRGYDRLVQEKGRVIFASCKSDQVSWELRGMRNSLFTHYLLEGLKGAAASKDGLVYVSALFGYVSRNVQKHARHVHQTQTPWFKGEYQDFALNAISQNEPPEHSHFEQLEKKEIEAKKRPNSNHVTLIKLLESRFQERDLRRAVFVVLGPGGYENLSGQTFTERSISLIEALKTRGKIDAFIDYVKENRPDINLVELGME